MLTHTKGFSDLRRDFAFDLIDTLRANLMAHVEDMQERINETASDYADDKRGWRDFLRETKAEFRAYWQDDLREFRDEALPQALVEHWEMVRENAEWEAEKAEKARQRAAQKLTQKSKRPT